MIHAATDPFARWLSEQERFEALRRRTLESCGRNLCDFAYANSWDGPAPEVVQALKRSLESERALDLQYTPYGGSTITRRLVARRLSLTHGEKFDWRDVVLTPGAMSALNILFRSVCDRGPGDQDGEVLVITPCWMDYPLYLANLGLTPKFVPVNDRTLRLDVDAISDALSARTRAVVLSQPANPTGILYSEEELRDLASVLDASPTRPLLISDECHRDVVFGPYTFVSPLEYYDETAVVYSFGKSFAIQGQRIGYAAVSPRMRHRRAFSENLERMCRVMGFCTPTALMQLAVRQLMKIEPDLGRFAIRREQAVSALCAAGYELTPSQATFFLYPRTPAADDFEFVERLAAEGVLALPASIFHHRGRFRLSLTATDEMLFRGLGVLREAVNRRTSA